ncbi:MAG TPA: FecR domain-containing protein [Acidisphaera sp.]|nr:FecR domain-containing protein [Acidisphaera sp.]
MSRAGLRATVLSVLTILALVALMPITPAGAEEMAVGYIKVVTGTATVHRHGAILPASVGMALQQADLLETGDDGEVGVTFRDNTRVALGPNSRLELSKFVFEPAVPRYGFVLRLLHGSLEYISGLTAKLAPDSMSVETPGATIAVRGTRFLVRADD